MNLPAILRTVADRDVDKAHQWYDRRGRGMGRRFRDRVELTIERIESNPYLYAPFWTDVRIASVPKFPYLVYYRVTPTRIDVFAVLHASRNRRAWRKRLS